MRKLGHIEFINRLGLVVKHGHDHPFFRVVLFSPPFSLAQLPSLLHLSTGSPAVNNLQHLSMAVQRSAPSGIQILPPQLDARHHAKTLLHEREDHTVLYVMGPRYVFRLSFFFPAYSTAPRDIEILHTTPIARFFCPRQL